MTVSIDANFPELGTHINKYTASTARFALRGRREGGRWSQCECSSTSTKAAFATFSGISLCWSAWETPGQAARRGGEGSLTARKIPAEVSWRMLQISREIQDQGTVHKARTNCGRG